MKIQFFRYLGHSEETFDHKLGNFFKKRASDLVLLPGAFRSFYFTEICQSQMKKLLKMSETDKNFDILDFLR